MPEPAPTPEHLPPSDGGRVPRVLVAGVGNMFLGDDGFGPEVARQLARQPVPDGVRVTDYGIRGMHLAFDLLDGWDRLILLDLLPSRGRPGAVHIIQIDADGVGDGAPDPHGMTPLAVLAGVGSLGGRLPPTVLVGCEPEDVSEGIGLSAAVGAAIGPAVKAVLALLVAGTPPNGQAGPDALVNDKVGDHDAPVPTSGGR